MTEFSHISTSANTVAGNMMRTFTGIRYFLLVGTGSGIPPKVRLGDVVVSVPTGTFPGVVQWDAGKAERGGVFRRTGALNNPPSVLLGAVSRMESGHELEGSRIPDHVEDLARKFPRLASGYLRSDALRDLLFKASYPHRSRRGQ